MSRLLLNVLIALPIAVIGAGCIAAPRVQGDKGIHRPSDWEEIAAPESYWVRKDVPRLKNSSVRRVVISEFAVEFVKTRYIHSGPAQGSLKVDPTQLMGLGVIGFNRRRADYEKALLAEVPDQLYQEFLRWVRLQGVEVIPDKEVTGSSSYQGYAFAKKDSSSVFKQLSPMGTDSGRIKSTVTYSASPLKLVEGGKDADVEDVDAALLRELNADLVIRARIRVGVFDERASVESGSVIAVTGPKVLGNVSSRRSLLSRQRVLQDKTYRPLKGRVYEVSSAKYKLAMETLFKQYLDLIREARGV